MTSKIPLMARDRENASAREVTENQSSVTFCKCGEDGSSGAPSLLACQGKLRFSDRSTDPYLTNNGEQT